MLNPFKYAERIPWGKPRQKILDIVLNLSIPFNRWLGLSITELSDKKVRVQLPFRTLSKNHVGGVHACAIALLGEYPAGLLLAQIFDVEDFRIIIKKLEVDYEKQGRGKLIGEAVAPTQIVIDVHEATEVKMQTRILNNKNELVATVTTYWQIKRWSAVRKKSVEA